MFSSQLRSEEGKYKCELLSPLVCSLSWDVPRLSQCLSKGGGCCSRDAEEYHVRASLNQHRSSQGRLRAGEPRWICWICCMPDPTPGPAHPWGARSWSPSFEQSSCTLMVKNQSLCHLLIPSAPSSRAPSTPPASAHLSLPHGPGLRLHS